MAAAIHATTGWRRNTRRRRWPALAAILGAHGLGFYALLQLGAVRERIAESMPLMVSFIAAPAAPQVQAPPPAPEPVKPGVEQHLIASPRPTQSTMQAPPQPVQEAPIADAEPTPPASPAPPAPAAAAPVTPPSFVAAYLDNPAPEYPRLSRRLKESGGVLLRVRVGAGGRAEQVELGRSSGYERLDQAALEAVRKWRFVAARQGDQAVAAWVIVPINFTLDQ
jgi:protein TonB